MASLLKRVIRKARRETTRRLRVLRSPLRATIVGCGQIAPEHIWCLEESGMARVVGVSDVRPGAMADVLVRWPEVRAFRDFRQMLTDTRPDIVCICTWPQTHAEIVEAAASAGVKGILCEKPLALTMADVKLMTAACQQRGVKLAGGHQYRFHAMFLEAANLIRRGAIGTIRLVRGNIESTLANNGPHLVDTIRFLLSDRQAIQATCRCERAGNAFNRGWPAEDSAQGEIVFEGDVSCHLETGARSRSFFGITVEGSGGTIEVSPQQLILNGKPLSLDAQTALDQCRNRQFSQFLRWVKGRQPDYAADGTQSALSAELVLALYESARLGTPIRLPLSNSGDVIRQLYPDVDSPEAMASAALPAHYDQRPIPVDPRLAMDGGPRALSRWCSSRPHLGKEELAGLTRVIVSGQLSCVDGTMVPALETAFSRAYGSCAAVASSSGTAAIHVAIAALNLNPCDEVITTPMSDMGTVIPILACNCLPVFADIDALTGNLTADSIAERITPRTKAIIVVHLFGRPADLESICALARRHNLAVIEDCAQAHFAEYDGRKVGTLGDLGCFSLQQSKQITCGDGGITLINREALVERATLFVDKGWNRKLGMRSHQFLGMNYRMTELQGAVALAQFKKLPGLVNSRRMSADQLSRELAALPGVRLPSVSKPVRPAWWMFNFAIDEEAIGVGSDDFADALRTEGVPVRRQYLPRPLFEEDLIKNRKTYGDSGYPFIAAAYRAPEVADFPGLQEFYRQQLIIPWSSRLQSRHVAGIVAAVRKVAAAAERKPCRPADVAVSALARKSAG